MPSPFLKAAQAAIKAAGSVGATETVKLRRKTGGTYDPATGNTSGEVTTDYPWTGVLESHTTGTADGSIVAGDRTFLGAAADIPVTPDPETDKLVIEGREYNIVPGGLARDTAKAAWSIRVRG